MLTGQTFIFLYISDASIIVYFYVYMLNLEIFDNDKTRLHYNAVAQVFAFVLQSSK